MKYIELYETEGNTYTFNYDMNNKKTVVDISKVDTFEVFKYNLYYSSKSDDERHRLKVTLKQNNKKEMFFYGFSSKSKEDIDVLYKELLLILNDNSSELIIKNIKKVYKCNKEKYNAKQIEGKSKFYGCIKNNINMVSLETIIGNSNSGNINANWFISPKLHLLLKRDVDNI